MAVAARQQGTAGAFADLSGCVRCRVCAHQVDAFTNKTGKFAIKGYPNKLGFLLHGPPGECKLQGLLPQVISWPVNAAQQMRT